MQHHHQVGLSQGTKTEKSFYSESQFILDVQRSTGRLSSQHDSFSGQQMSRRGSRQIPVYSATPTKQYIMTMTDRGDQDDDDIELQQHY